MSQEPQGFHNMENQLQQKPEQVYNNKKKVLDDENKYWSKHLCAESSAHKYIFNYFLCCQINAMWHATTQ